MALGDLYVDLAGIKNYTGLTQQAGAGDTVDDIELTSALTAICREVEKVCNRQFNDAGTTSSRVYYPTRPHLLKVDDFSTTVGLTVALDLDDDGVYETPWTLGTDYQVEPLNGIVDGQPGWPYWKIRAIGGQGFPCRNRRPPAQVAARWGWAAVPPPIPQAVKIASTETFKLKDAAFGVASFDQYGAIRVRENPFIQKLLGPYVRDPIQVG